MSRTHALSEKGKRARGTVPKNKGSNLTVLGAMRATGEVEIMTIDSGTTSDVFEAFCRQVLIPFLKSGDIVVLDNLGAHKNKNIIELLRAKGVHIHFQPPYTPESNAIELLWGWLKQRIRKREPRTRESLEKELVIGIEELQPEFALGWSHLCGYGAI